MAISGPEALNKLLRNLRAKDFDLLAPHLKKREFHLGYEIESPNVSIAEVVFIETGLVSVIAGRTPGPQVQITIAGVEGMTGTSVVLGASQTSPTTSVVMPQPALRCLPAHCATLCCAARHCAATCCCTCRHSMRRLHQRRCPANIKSEPDSPANC